MTTTYRVSGMTCEGCVHSVRRAIERAIPGRKVAVDLARGTVALDGAAEESAIRRAVEDAGFGFGGAA